MRALRLFLALALACALATPAAAQWRPGGMVGKGGLRSFAAVAPPPTMLTYRYAGFTGQTPNATYTTNSTKTRQLYYLTDAVMSPSDSCAVWFDAWAFTGSEVNGAAYNVIRMSVQAPATGATTPVTFSAGRTVTVASGAQRTFSDEFTASSLGFSYFTPGTILRFKGVGSTAGSVTDVTRDRGVMNGPGGAAVISGDLSGYYQDPGDGSDTNQVDTFGPWSSIPAGAVGANVHFPSGIVCRTTSTANPILSVVDSLGDGYLAFSFDPAKADSGGLIRAAAWAAQKPLFTFGRYGTKPSQFSTKTLALVQAQYSSSRLFSSVIQQNFTNEFDGIKTLATIESEMVTLWGNLADAGGPGGARPVYAFNMVIPNQTSTAGATTYPSQTKYAGGPAYFEAYNTWLAGKGPGGDNTVQGVLAWTGMYDPAQSNKITVIGTSWTLVTGVSSGATTLRLSGGTAPQPGDGLWIGGTGAEAVMVNTVSVVTPGSVWDVTLYATTNTQQNIGGATAAAHSSGVTVSASYQPFDLAHFTQNGHALMKATLVGAAPFN